MKRCPKCGKEYENANTLCPSDGAVLEKTEDELLGQTLADKYRIEERISEGGMGAVYRATHVLMDKTVAIKVLHPALAADDKIVARFSREARAASRISHPHALSVTDFGESENGIVFLVMEYLRGNTLKEVIHGDGLFALPRAVEIMRQVCGALEAAHGEGVVHRDLKSDNIMLVDVGSGSGGDWAKVLDFGIAKIQEPEGEVDSALTAPNLIIGTPQYMSPEQCSQASEIDARSDIYSLGVILYEMLAGHVPFTGDSPTAIMMKHLQEPSPSILEERSDVPAGVGRVIVRALAKRPEDRYQTATELADALGDAASTETPASVPAINPSTDQDTGRIIAATEESELARGTSSEEYDDATLVRPQQAGERVRDTGFAMPRDVMPPLPPPLAAESLNPWRILIPTVIGLVLLFAVIYAVTRDSGQPAANDNAAPLAIDPNSSPVQPGQTPTGRGEQGINPTIPSAPAVSTSTITNANSDSGANENENTLLPPPVNLNTNRNDNTQRDEDTAAANDNEAPPVPTPSNSNQRRELPAPQTNPAVDPAELPKAPPPTPRKKQPELPKPSLPADTDAPPAGIDQSN